MEIDSIVFHSIYQTGAQIAWIQGGWADVLWSTVTFKRGILGKNEVLVFTA